MLIKVEANELRIGMYVAELDRPWLDTPFLLQGFLVEEEEELASLRHYCAFVFVDSGRSAAGLFPAHQSPAFKPAEGLRLRDPHCSSRSVRSSNVLATCSVSGMSIADQKRTYRNQAAVPRTTKVLRRNPYALISSRLLSGSPTTLKPRSSRRKSVRRGRLISSPRNLPIRWWATSAAARLSPLIGSRRSFTTWSTAWCATLTRSCGSPA